MSESSQRADASQAAEYRQPRFLASVLALAGKDLAAEWRSRETLGAMVVFTLLSILLFNFALELQIQLRGELAAGVLWVTLAFGGTLGLNRSLAMEQERGCMDGLLLTPVDRSAIFFGKALANLIFMLLISVILVPLFSLLYGSPMLQPGVALVIFLGTLGYVSIGTLLSTMAVQTRTRDMLLPILLFPLILPVLIAAVRASSGYIDGAAFEGIRPWLNLLIGYDVMFIAVPILVFDSVVQE